MSQYKIGEWVKLLPGHDVPCMREIPYRIVRLSANHSVQLEITNPTSTYKAPLWWWVYVGLVVKCRPTSMTYQTFSWDR